MSENDQPHSQCDTPPFDPPYKTFVQMADGLRIFETLPDGSTQVISADEATQLAFKEQQRTASLPRPNVPPRAVKKPSAQPLTSGNDRAVMYLDVPFAEKDHAKRLGARWDKDMRKWYIPHGTDINLFDRWWPDALKQEAKPFGQL